MKPMYYNHFRCPWLQAQSHGFSGGHDRTTSVNVDASNETRILRRANKAEIMAAAQVRNLTQLR